jgi:hypothetical protein
MWLVGEPREEFERIKCEPAAVRACKRAMSVASAGLDPTEQVHILGRVEFGCPCDPSYELARASQVGLVQPLALTEEQKGHCRFRGRIGCRVQEVVARGVHADNMFVQIYLD